MKVLEMKKINILYEVCGMRKKMINTYQRYQVSKTKVYISYQVNLFKIQLFDNLRVIR